MLSLYGLSALEESGYTDSLMYLSEKNKIGVVKVDSGSPLKDAYIVALQGEELTVCFLTYGRA